MSNLILASTSPYRKALLKRLGLPFRCCAPTIDEEVLKQQYQTDADFSPEKLAQSLARDKALSLSETNPRSTIIAGDQLVAFEGKILGKPGTAQRAVEQLCEMAGKTHDLITALVVWHEGQLYPYTDITRLTMRSLNRQEIQHYVEADQPLDCAGAYKVEARGIVLFQSIHSEDQTAISGLPLIRLTSILRKLCYSVP